MDALEEAVRVLSGLSPKQLEIIGSLILTAAFLHSTGHSEEAITDVLRKAYEGSRQQHDAGREVKPIPNLRKRKAKNSQQVYPRPVAYLY